MQFIPRYVLYVALPTLDHALWFSDLTPSAFVFIVISLLYARLFVFLRRPDKIRSPHSNPTVSSSHSSVQGALRRASRQSTGRLTGWFRQRGVPSHFTQEQVVATVVDHGVPDAEFSTEDDAQRRRQDPQSHSRSRSTSVDPVQSSGSRRPSRQDDEDIPPWERVELPPFQIDGQKFGGTSSNSHHSASLWSGWKGLGGTSTLSRKRPSTASSSPPPASTRKLGSFSSWELQSSPSTRRPSAMSPRLEPISSFGFGRGPGDDNEREEEEEEHGPKYIPRTRQSRDVDTRRESRICIRDSSISEQSRQGQKLSISDSGHAFAPLVLAQPVGQGTDLKSTTPAQNSAPTTPLGATFNLDNSDRRPSGATDSKSTRTPESILRTDYAATRASTPAAGIETEKAIFELVSSEPVTDIEKQAERDRSIHEDEDAEWDLMRMLQQGGPAKGQADERFAPAQGETVEFVEESMASYLNRKTALLMLWFPLGVSLLKFPTEPF